MHDLTLYQTPTRKSTSNSGPSWPGHPIRLVLVLKCLHFLLPALIVLVTPPTWLRVVREYERTTQRSFPTPTRTTTREQHNSYGSAAELVFMASS